MTDSYRALVVDKEAALRSLTIHALHREGFSCDSAANGVEAVKLIQSNYYDAVITDPLLPGRNGRPVALEMLASAHRPAVVILTGVLDPEAAKDWTARGADCLELKPVSFALFAAKVRGLVTRRARREDAGAEGGPQGKLSLDEYSPAEAGGGTQDAGPAGMPGVQEKLSQLSKILPVSPAAFDVFSMTSADAYQTPQIAAAIARDASLSVDVLRLANSAYYNPAARKIIELDEAVLRIGRRRVGDLALATSVLAALTPRVLPWMNADLTWRRSVAAGVAVDLLLSEGACPEACEGLFLSATMHPLGRIALGTLYPQRYQSMVRTCEERNESLSEQERRVFGVTHQEVMGSLLTAWGVPEEVSQPLQHSSGTYGSLSQVDDPLHRKAELLKLAILIARLAAGEWEPWDQVELPPAAVVERLRIESFSAIIQGTKSDSQEIVCFRPQALAEKRQADVPSPARRPLCGIRYCNLSPEPFDFLGQIVSAKEIGAGECEPESLAPHEPMLVNCIGSPPSCLSARIDRRRSREATLIVTDAARVETFRQFGHVLSLPASYGALRATCARIATHSTRPAQLAAAGRR
jgi:HD-like signal output (HDOD) protein/CheY-like chemotaxis protein